MGTKIYLILLLFLSFIACEKKEVSITIDGELQQWHKITLFIDGPETSENAVTNPFLDYRLDVTFSKGEKKIVVPGFYCADGNAAETSASEGNKWAVRFRPDESGEWIYSVSFKTAENISVDENISPPDAVEGDGLTGSFYITESDKEIPDFRAKGRIYHDGGHYFKHNDGSIFLKGGADSPENFLAYVGFDQTYRYGNKVITREGEANPKANLHVYEPHISDWKEGDPLWHGDKGKGIIGALNYLASQGMNSQYMVTMNILGDGKDVWPWTAHNERYRFDCSKLDQWEIVFDHMDRLGMMIHLVLQETENEVLLDGGHTATQRKLYLRELIARFSHHLAVEWNMGEENGPAGFSPVGQTEKMKREMAQYIKQINPYPNIVVLHTHSDPRLQDEYLLPLLNFKELNGPSMQIGNPMDIHQRIKYFVNVSANAGHRWIVCLDELGQHWKGIMPDSYDVNHDTVRNHALWGTMMAGGAGVEWYFGYKYPHNDLDCEDFRSRENWWEQTRICLDLFQQLPLDNMKSADGLISDKDSYCFADAGNIYVIYTPVASKQLTINTGSTLKNYSVFWYNPRTGGDFQKGSIDKIRGGGRVKIGLPPRDHDRDWVVVLR